MKKQIIDSGIHNADIPRATARLLKGASYKRQRIVVIIPVAEMVPVRAYLSHINLIFPPNQAVFRMAAVGYEVGEAYSVAIEQILAHPDVSQWEYILTIEADNIPPNDGVIQLIEAMEAHPELSAIGGLYWTKGEGGVPQIWGDPNDPVINYRPQLPRPGEIVECYGTGMGFTLWRLSMFRDPQLRQPWFKTVQDKTGVGTQDLYFWSDARKFGYRCAVDCRVLVGHLDPVADMVW